MSRKSKRNRMEPDARSAASAPGANRSGLWIGVAAALVAVVLATFVMYKVLRPGAAVVDDSARSAALASEHSPTLGNPAAKVHVVEFFDPACETCAQFFPIVKQVMSQNPDRILLSVRHVAFHEGSEFAVKVLEASRKQDKYWETLQALFESQRQWAPNHVAQPDLVLAAVAKAGLNLDQLQADMNSPEVAQRMARDLDAAMALKVTATPEYFVNGRGLPSFGEQQLRDLLADELQKAY
jgi:protein-disulfide isomerase